MTTPVRIQLQRTKGWRMPPNTVKVDRSTKWGNPFKPGEDFTAGFTANHRRIRQKVRDVDHAVELFGNELSGRYWGRLYFSRDDLIHLRGKNLACWCKPGAPCHADALLELANRPLAVVP